MELEEFKAHCLSERRKTVESLKSPRESQLQTLRECLEPNADTVYGREHGFAKIKTPDEYRRAVPIRDYNGIAKYVERSAAGEEAVLTRERPFLFFTTSGTTGPSKLIPATSTWMLKSRVPGLHSTWGNLLHHRPDAVASANAVLDLNFDRRPVKQYTPGGIPCQGFTQRSILLGAGDWSPPWEKQPWYVAPPEMNDYADRVYLRLRHFVERDMRVLITLNPSTALAFAQHLNQKKEALIRDLLSSGKEGSIKRARELEQIAKKQDTLLPRDIWPHLDVIMCWTSASAGLYLDELTQTFGSQMKLLPHLTGGSEGCYAIPIDERPSGAALAVRHCFFEFVPGDRDVAEDSETLLCDQLEVGKEYHLIFTQGSGLYRHVNGDSIRVLEIKDGVRFVEFVGRAGNVSFTGEKLTESQMIASVTAAKEKCGLEVGQYACFPRWASPPYYQFLIEPPAPWKDGQLQKFAAELETQMREHNEEYPSKVTSGRLGPVRVSLVSVGTFAKHWEATVKKGVAAAQVKHKVLYKDDSMLSVFLGYSDGRA